MQVWMQNNEDRINLHQIPFVLSIPVGVDDLLVVVPPVFTFSCGAEIGGVGAERLVALCFILFFEVATFEPTSVKS